MFTSRLHVVGHVGVPTVLVAGGNHTLFALLSSRPIYLVSTSVLYDARWLDQSQAMSQTLPGH